MSKLNYLTDSFQIRKAAKLVQHGGVIAYPTEAVYGLGCHPDSEQALQYLLDLKKRPWQKGLILVASEVSQIIPYISQQALELLNCFDKTYDYPVTWLLPVHESVSPLLCGAHDKIAVRISSNSHVQALCGHLEAPLVSTSANKTGQPEITQAHLVRAKFKHSLDQIIAGEVGGYNRPSAIIDAQTQAIIRPY